MPVASSAQSWSPAQGRVYPAPGAAAAAAATTAKQREATPLPEANKATTDLGISLPGSQLIEEALLIHEQYGDHNLDENPITGRPGEFLLASTGRKPVNLSNSKKAAAQMSLPALNTKLGGENPLTTKPTGKETKSPKTPGGGSLQKKKRKGSKAAATPQ